MTSWDFPGRLSAALGHGSQRMQRRARVETVNSKDVEIKDGQGKVLRCISLATKGLTSWQMQSPVPPGACRVPTQPNGL